MNLEDNWIDKLSEIVSRPSKRRRMNGPPNLSFLTLNSDSIKNEIMFLVDISQETEMQKLLIRAGIIITNINRDLHTYHFHE